MDLYLGVFMQRTHKPHLSGFSPFYVLSGNDWSVKNAVKKSISISIDCFYLQPSFTGYGRAWFTRKESKRKYETVSSEHTSKHPSLNSHPVWWCTFFSNFALQLLDYVSTAIFFSDKNVDSNLVAWNRVVLLHGKDELIISTINVFRYCCLRRW